MRQAQLGSVTTAHTIKSHGIRVARKHMYDWLILVLLAVIDIILNVIHPFYRYVGEAMINDFKYPLKDNTVPFWAVPMIAILLPLAIIIAIYFRRRDVYDLHHAILGLLFSALITGVITDAIKDAVGRPRPDFFWRCFPDGNPVYKNVTREVICNGEDHVVKEGHKSFPSGHTSCKIKVFDRRGHVAKLCLILLPLLVAALVGISRVDDYWHHWQDVFTGGLIGWGPHEYFRILDEMNGSAQPTNTVNPLSAQVMEAETVYQQEEHNDQTGSYSYGAYNDGISLREMEAGRK
ncbi:hypothetical protein MRB53_018510 [Persea americana]|uniref:Uncharacterized protein n=1 Tax=Persea americana TaxID=3435 RepID=A0ACC2M7N8_PERAE|nr:hypothetical protein MRB53_018510 [Persea americana]